MTFNVVRFSGPTPCSELYTDFVRILADLHVPAENMYEFSETSAKATIQPFMDAFKDRRDMRYWIRCQTTFCEERKRERSIDIIGDFPVSREERIAVLLDADFSWEDCQYLAHEIQAVADQVIVGRTPALLPSDVQKMRIVQRPSLSHLEDVLVFATRGPCA